MILRLRDDSIFRNLDGFFRRPLHDENGVALDGQGTPHGLQIKSIDLSPLDIENVEKDPSIRVFRQNLDPEDVADRKAGGNILEEFGSGHFEPPGAVFKNGGNGERIPSPAAVIRSSSRRFRTRLAFGLAGYPGFLTVSWAPNKPPSTNKVPLKKAIDLIFFPAA